ncbi:MAG: CD1871A family CXXC motif-containing protein [Peptoniphilaceae bacterium]
MNKFILSMAIILIFLGIYSGEVQSVMLKAANLCMECIGLA